MKLTTHQEELLRRVKIADEQWRRAKRDAVTLARMAAAREVSDYLERRDDEVRLAFENGVPQLQIGRDGLGTTSSSTVRESLARTAGVAALLANFPVAPFEQAVSA